MASRFARGAIGATTLLRPTLLASRAIRAGRTTLTPALTAIRASTTSSGSEPSKQPAGPAVPAEDPQSRAQALIDALPGSSLISKSAILSSAAGLSVYAISNEYYVVNEETIAAFCLLCIWTAIFKYGGPAHSEWAEAQTDRIMGVLNQAREDHKEAVRSRIRDVSQMDGVVDFTKALFEVSKETARLEAQAYELQQKTAIAAEAKSVLDSWVRYEGQVKIKQQKELAENVIGRVKKDLEDSKVLQQILQQSVADVEKIVSSKNQ